MMLLEILLLSITSVSVISTSVVFVSYLTFPDLRTPIYRVIAYLALSDFIWEFIVILCQLDTEPSNCPLYSFLVTGFQLASVAWTVYIAYIVKDSIIHQREHTPRFSWWIYPAVFFAVPVGFGALPLTTNSYNSSEMDWCMMAKSSSSMTSLWFIVIFNVPLVLGLCYCAASYYSASRVMGANLSVLDLNVNELRRRLQYIRKLKIFPLILVLCWLPGFIVELILLGTGYDLNYLDHVFALLSCLQGVFNAIAYSYSSILGYYLRNRFCPRRRQRDEDFKDELIDDLLRL